MKKNEIFSFIKDQSIFMTAIMSLLSFLSILIIGIVLSITTGIKKWNNQWELFGTIQILSDDISNATEVIDKNRNIFEKVTKISKDEIERILKPWSSSGKIPFANYFPTVYEVKFKDIKHISNFKNEISKFGRFLSHSDAVKNTTNVGINIIYISIIILILTIGTIITCILYIVKNTAQIHQHELFILNQVGASDNFVVKQMQKIVGKICLVSGAIGFIFATPIILLIIKIAKSSKIGFITMIGLDKFSLWILLLTPVIISLASLSITRKVTNRILEQN